MATQIQGLLVLNYPDYVFQRYHGTLLMWAVVLLGLLINVFGIAILPHIGTVSGLCHLAFYFALLIPLVYLAPKKSASFVFTSFQNNSGWSSDGVSWCVGLLTMVFSLVGKYSSDSGLVIMLILP